LYFLFYNSDFISDLLTAHFMSDYWCEKLLEYSIKIMGDHAEGKGTTESKYTNQFIMKTMPIVNLYLMVT